MDYFISDLHFSHRNILKYIKRPFKDVNEMNEALIERWNNAVSKNDRVIVVGDMFLCMKETASGFMSRLNGTKILIKGNHDKWTNERYKSLGFSEVYFRSIDYKMPSGRKALVSHYPIPDDLIAAHDLQIHGHSHSSEKQNGKRINVCCEAWDYTPVSIDELDKIKVHKEKNRFCKLSTSKQEKTVEINAKVHLQNLDGLIKEIYHLVGR